MIVLNSSLSVVGVNRFLVCLRCPVSLAKREGTSRKVLASSRDTLRGIADLPPSNNQLSILDSG